MALTYSQMNDLGQVAPAFSLKGVDGKTYSLDSFQENKALLVTFMCNHCPYVVAIQDRLNTLTKKFQKENIGFIGINSNDFIRYPDDGFDAMKSRAAEVGYEFPYVLDYSQEVAKAYGAVCTPDFFLFQKNETGNFLLVYRGQLDDNWKNPAEVTKTPLEKAIVAVINNQSVSPEQTPSMGCSIKWKI